MKHDPYLVVGTGRSGTSTVARILHTKLGVFMGHSFPPANESNPQGFYEDVEFNQLGKDFMNNKLGYGGFKGRLSELIAARGALARPWGVKDPRMAHFLGFYLEEIANPRIIRCRRKGPLVVASLMKWYGWTEDFATAAWSERERALDRMLKGRDHLSIYFDEHHFNDEEIAEAISLKWDRKLKVYFALLNQGWIRREMAWHMIERIKTTPGIEVEWENPNKTFANPIAANRNQIVKRFLATDCDFLLMIDDDVIPYGNPVPFAAADRDIIGFPAKVKQKGRSMNWVAYVDTPRTKGKRGYAPLDFGAIDDKDADLVEVEIIGTGAVLIARRVLEGMKAPFCIEYDEDGIPIYGTDFSFCRKARSAGWKIYTTPNLVCEHMKEVGLLDISSYDDSDYRDTSANKYEIPFGDNAISIRDWHFIRDIMDDIKPRRVLEFGSGLSSLLMSERAKVTSYETDEKYAEDIRSRSNGNELDIRIWDGVKFTDRKRKYDMAFIDGPLSLRSGGPGREEAVRAAAINADHIILHDAGRMDESKWQEKYLREKFSLEARSGYHQIRCHYWKRKESTEDGE